METEISQFLGDLDAGMFQQKVGKALSDVAGGVIDHSAQGKVQITLTLKQMGNSNQVLIEHQLAYSAPTANGEFAEKNTTRTPMHVNEGGEITLFPKNQSQLFDKHGQIEK